MAKKQKENILVKAAEETNMVMAYGMDDKGKVVDPDEQIDTSLTDKALEKELESRLKEDLRMEDKEDFSADVWALFEEKGWGPFASKDEEESEEEEEDAEEPEGEEAPEEDAEEEEEEAPKPKKSKKEEKPAKKSKKPAKEEDEEEEKPKKSKRDEGEKKPRAPRDKGPSFEQIAMDIVKSTDPKDAREALLEKFTGLYHERGKTDEDFIRMRVDIYYKIACTRLHVEMVGVPAKKKVEKKPSKKVEKKEEEAPKKSKRG